MSYSLIGTTRTTCSNCYKPVDLLCPDVFHMSLADKPSFYICFHCKTVGQIGVGPVRREPPEPAENS